MTNNYDEGKKFEGNDNSLVIRTTVFDPVFGKIIPTNK